MRYKMQFTVCNDDVKQDRKLPTISFFDTDGNPIDLGAGVGGGSVDLSHLTELGFGSPTDVILSRSHARGLSIDNQLMLTQDSGEHGLFLTDGSEVAAIAGQFLDHGAFLRFGLYDEADYTFKIDTHGKIEWGDGTAEPDTSIQRKESNGDGYLAVVNNGGLYQWSGLAVQTDPYQAMLYSDEDGYAGLYVHSAPSSIILESQISNAGVLEAADRFNLDSDGKMQWGDGTVVPDVSLERNGAGKLGFAASGGVDFIGNGIGVSANSDYDVSYATLGGDGRLLQQLASLDKAYLTGLITDSNWAFTIDARGKIEWGDGTAAPDTHIFRMSPGALKVVASAAQSETDLVVESPTTGDHVYLGAYDGGSYIQMTGDDQDLYLGDILKIHGGVQIDDALDFNGASSTAGATFGWDDDWAGMVLKGRAGSGDSELYVVHPDNSAAYANLYFIGGSAVLLLTDANGHSGFLTAGSPAGDHLGLTMNGDLAFFGGKSVVLRSPDNSFHRLKVANDGSLSTESVS